ncbi:MAG: hypothetical protein IJR88_00425 [Clostridia bacterium]|nr:hypothetical protein [Clostridia bacterium]
MASPTRNKLKLSLFELLLFSMLGALMFVSKLALEFLPNIHLLGVLTMVYTLTFRWKALFPIYCYVLIQGVYAGFNVWWIPYCYLWTILWGVTMLLPKKLPEKRAAIVIYPLVCCLHGALFGTLYAPAQALFFHLDWNGMIAWIIAGLPWDGVHAVGNLAVGFLILPLYQILSRLYSKMRSRA